MATKHNINGSAKAAFWQTLIADKKAGEQWPAKANFFRVASGFTESSNETEVETESYADYAGNGSPYNMVKSVSESFKFEGEMRYGDPAQELIRSKEDATGTETDIWVLRVAPDGAYKLGEGTLSDIKMGGGSASENDKAEVTIGFKGGVEKGYTLAKTKDNNRPDVFSDMTRTGGENYSANFR